MHKFWKRVSIVFSLGTFGLLFSVGWLSNRKEDKVAKNMKRNHLKTSLAQFVNVPLDPDNEAWLQNVINKTQPGTLVCLRQKDRSKEGGRLFEVAVTSKYEKTDQSDASLKIANKKKVSISQLSSTRAVGCCPNGNPFGKVYRTGFACCIDQVFNVLTQFCCSTNYRLLPLTTENLNYCHPPNGIHYCREKDLEMQQKWPMAHSCVNNSRNTPETCLLSCPVGSLPKRGIDQVKCTRTGAWDKLPICCQGCQQDFKLDVWFLIQVPKNQDDKNNDILKDFLKTLVSYLPISQEAVRVGFDLISKQRNIDTAVWDLTSHENHEDVNSTIDILSLQGFGSEVGKALTWLGQNGFSRSFGDRKEVENLVIPILYDTPEDSIFGGASALKKVAKVVPIAIGNAFTDEDLSVISSSRNKFYRAEERDKLNLLSANLHKHICGEACVLRVTKI